MKIKKGKAFEFKKFDGIANKTSLSEIKKNLLKSERIDLFPKEKIVKLNIPWGELYSVCNDEEWNEVYEILEKNSIEIKKWNILNYFLRIQKPFFLFIGYFIAIVLVLILYIRFR